MICGPTNRQHRRCERPSAPACPGHLRRGVTLRCPRLRGRSAQAIRALGTAGAAMDDVGHQCVMRLKRDRVIAPTEAERRLLARTVLTVGRDFPIVAFRFGDTHGHMAVAADEVVAAECARRIESGLKQRLKLPVPFARVEITPIRDVWHMKNVVRYTFTQDEHHGFRNDPLHEASSLPDALGWRAIDTPIAFKLKEQQPRLRRGDLLQMVRMADPNVPALWDGDWLDAVAAAICRTDGSGKHRDALAARSAIVQLAIDSFSPAEIRDRLEVSARAYGRLLEITPPAAMKRAVRQQLVLRSPTFVRTAPEAKEPKATDAAGLAADERRFVEP